jgi:RHS repeat-associated protein
VNTTDSSFPKLTVLESSTTKNNVRFAGRDQYTVLGDVNDAWYNNRARTYRSRWGRFHGRDPALAAIGSHTYSYGASSPPNYTDPTGLVPICNYSATLLNEFPSSEVVAHDPTCHTQIRGDFGPYIKQCGEGEFDMHLVLHSCTNTIASPTPAPIGVVNGWSYSYKWNEHITGTGSIEHGLEFSGNVGWKSSSVPAAEAAEIPPGSVWDMGDTSGGGRYYLHGTWNGGDYADVTARFHSDGALPGLKGGDMYAIWRITCLCEGLTTSVSGASGAPVEVRPPGTHRITDN